MTEEGGDVLSPLVVALDHILHLEGRAKVGRGTQNPTVAEENLLDVIHWAGSIEPISEPYMTSKQKPHGGSVSTFKGYRLHQGNDRFLKTV